MKNKNKIKVHLLASPHPQFDEILDFPPKGVSYTKSRVKTRYHGWFTEKRITWHKRIMNIIPVPRMTHTKTNADIVHSTRGIIQIKQKKPWIIDLECGPIFTSFNWKAMKNPIVRKIIMSALTSKNCKKVLPQSEAAKRTFIQAIGEKNFNKIKDKVEVLYLSLRPCKKKKIKRKDKKVVLSFVGRAFYGKGGPHLLKAYEILSKKYPNLEIKYKGDIPEEWEGLAKRLPGFKQIKGYLSRDELFEKMYLSSDIYVMPTNKDNYGVVFLEAMSAGLPIVSTTSMTVPEIVQDGKNGFLVKTDLSHENYYDRKGEYTKIRQKVDRDIVKQLVDKLSILIEDKKLREKMGKEGRKMIEDKNGKFSIEKRNKDLRKIYDECLR
ncbi:MAG: glycosyltransferase family 4 protein [Candidatus Pacearchaeota archaeon]